VNNLQKAESAFSDLPETQLVQMTQARNGDAYKELVARSWDMCSRLALGLLDDREDALDEVQEAFWRAYTHIDSFNQQSKFSTWVGRIVINLCLMRLRRARHVRFVSNDCLNSDGEEYVAHEAVDLETPENMLGAAEVRRLVRWEVKHIPSFLRNALELHFIHDLSVEEVACRLNISVPAAKSRVHRAQGYLRNRMLRHCGDRGLATLTMAR